MDERGIVQKDEIVIIRPPCSRLGLMRELEITLLSDCLGSQRTPK